MHCSFYSTDLYYILILNNITIKRSMKTNCSLRMFMKARFQTTVLRHRTYPFTEIDVFICCCQPELLSVNWLHMTVHCASTDVQHLIVRSISFTFVVKVKNTNLSPCEANRYSLLSPLIPCGAYTIMNKTPTMFNTLGKFIYPYKHFSAYSSMISILYHIHNIWFTV